MARSKSIRFDPQSLDATLARIIEGQRQHAEEMRACFADTKTELLTIKEQAFKTNGRVGVLELWRATSTAKIAGIAAALGAVGGAFIWLAGILLKS